MTDSLAAGLRVAIYARVSSEEQREGQTIDSQVAELERFARDKGWPVIDTYRDDGWSGGVMERPQLDRLRDDGRNGRFAAVLLNDVDRLARDVTHLGIIKRDLERHGIRLIFRKLPAETSPTYNLMVNILGSFAEFEREMIADRTRRGRRYKVEVRKCYPGTNAPYGYRYVPKNRSAGEDGRLELMPAEAAVVRQMFEWVDAEGLSARRVVARLNESRTPTHSGAARWGKSSVLRILRNETYAGVWHFNKLQSVEPRENARPRRYVRRVKCAVRVRPRGEWIPLELPPELCLVERGQWARVQSQLTQNIAFSPRNERHFYLLKGLVRCSACGARYVGDPVHGRSYYRCLARCKGCPSVREEALSGAIIGAIRDTLSDPSLVLERLHKQQQENRRIGERKVSDAREATKAIEQIAVEESRLLEAYRSGAMTPLQLGQQLDLLAARRSTLNGRPTGENVAIEPPPEVRRKSIEEYCRETRAKIDALDPVQLRRLLQGLVQEVRFDGSTAVLTGRFPIPTGGGSLPAQNPDPPTGLRPRYRGAMVATRSMETPDPVGLRPRYRGAVVATPTFGCPFEIAVAVPPAVLERFVDAEGHYCRASAAVRVARSVLPRRGRGSA
jgi:site-specific DNA recombinase